MVYRLWNYCPLMLAIIYLLWVCAVLEQKDSIPRAIAHAASKIQSSKYSIPGPASNTYDDFWELPIDTYVASMYPLVMHGSAILANAIGNTTLAATCAKNATQVC